MLVHTTARKFRTAVMLGIISLFVFSSYTPK